MPSEWAPVLLGGEIPQLDDKIARVSFNVLMSHFNDILHRVQNKPDTYEPVFWRDPAGQDVVDNWVRGFIDGYRLRAGQWAELIDHEDKKILSPIFIHLRTEDGSYALDGGRIDDDVRRIAATHIRTAVLEIDRFWRQRRKRAIKQVRPDAKAGRNDPCTCGSGRKYKKCCGAN